MWSHRRRVFFGNLLGDGVVPRPSQSLKQSMVPTNLRWYSIAFYCICRENDRIHQSQSARITGALRHTRYSEMRSSAVGVMDPAKGTGCVVGFLIGDFLRIDTIMQVNTGEFIRFALVV